MALPDPSPDSTALVTGASSGIGEAIARELASRGHGVTLVARREGRLKALAEELSKEHGIRAEVVVADLSRSKQRDKMAGAIDDLGLTVEVLVNNAGFGDFGPFAEADRGRQNEMVRILIGAVVDLESRYLAGMVERGQGAVLNTASTSAFQPLPNMATYSSSKAFVLHHSEAVHTELKGTGVSVTAVCPGPVKTEFVDAGGLGNAAENTPGLFWTSVEDVAKDAVDAMAAGKRSVVPGRLNELGAMWGRHTPRSVLMPALKRLSHRMRY